MNQSTDTVLMVKPSSFRANEQTAVNNYFQDTDSYNPNTNTIAQAEFENLVQTLDINGIRVIVIEDNGKYDTPDSLFPNNVISFHDDKAILYPMFAPNRQRELFLNHLGELEKQGLSFKTLKDYSIYADQDLFLEGTGVLILDRINKVVYCSLSERAHIELLEVFCEDNHYKSVIFHATQQVDDLRLPIYHSNVMMALGTDFCVISLDSIQDLDERDALTQSLQNTNKTIIEISEEQAYHFCGNILELRNKDNETLIVMSEQAFKSFSEEQIKQLEEFGKIIHTPIYTIEKYGGGSVRCMIAEVFHR